MATRPREDRRRRMRTDEANAPPPAEKKRSRASGGSAKLYAAGAITKSQPRISELVPRRKRWMSVWFLLSLIPIALVEQLYVLRVSSRLQSVLDHTSALHLFGAGTVANWVASTLLLLSSVAGLIIYSIRRHKVDDYSGRYRLWLWASAFCLFCSLDAATGIHRIFMVLMMRITKRELWAGGIGWWLFTGATIAAVISFLALRDMWRSRGASITLLASIGCYVAATLFYLRIFSIGSGDRDMMSWSAFLLSGHALLFDSFLVYLRYVNLEAAGQVDSSAPKSRKKNPNAKPRLSRSLSQNPQSSEKPKKKITTAKKKPPKSRPAADESEEDAESSPKLTIKGKKAMQKQKRQQRRAA